MCVEGLLTAIKLLGEGWREAKEPPPIVRAELLMASNTHSSMGVRFPRPFSVLS